MEKREMGEQEWRNDLKTEGLIVGKNQHSVYHICAKHGTGIDLPQKNKCLDCYLFLSGADVRYLLAAQRADFVKKIEERKRNKFHCHCSIGKGCSETCTDALDEVIKLIKE